VEEQVFLKTRQEHPPLNPPPSLSDPLLITEAPGIGWGVKDRQEERMPEGPQAPCPAGGGTVVSHPHCFGVSLPTHPGSLSIQMTKVYSGGTHSILSSATRVTWACGVLVHPSRFTQPYSFLPSGVWDVVPGVPFHPSLVSDLGGESGPPGDPPWASCFDYQQVRYIGRRTVPGRKGCRSRGSQGPSQSSQPPPAWLSSLGFLETLLGAPVTMQHTSPVLSAKA
jgi:hypothetical protein